MNCGKCHHIYEAHARGDSGAAGCMIPTCTCSQYVDPIRAIDEELL